MQAIMPCKQLNPLILQPRPDEIGRKLFELISRNKMSFESSYIPPISEQPVLGTYELLILGCPSLTCEILMNVVYDPSRTKWIDSWRYKPHCSLPSVGQPSNWFVISPFPIIGEGAEKASLWHLLMAVAQIPNLSSAWSRFWPAPIVDGGYYMSRDDDNTISFAHLPPDSDVREEFYTEYWVRPLISDIPYDYQ